MASASDAADWSGEGGYLLSFLGPVEAPRRPGHTIDGNELAIFYLEDEDVLAKYNNLSIELYTDPCYAASSVGPLPADFDCGDFSAAYNGTFIGPSKHHDWKPAYSGKTFRWFLWVSVLLALGGYFAISQLAHTPAGRMLAWWAPAALSSALVFFTTTVVSAEIRRQGYQPYRTADGAQHQAVLRRYRWLVVFVLAPLLGVPIWPASRFVTIDAAQNIRNRLPTRNTSGQASVVEVLRRQKRDAWQAWGWPSSLIGSHDRGITYDFDVNEDGPTTGILQFGEDRDHLFKNNYELRWDDVLEGEIFTMPFSVQHNFNSDMAAASAVIRTPLEQLFPYLECNLINQETLYDLTTMHGLRYGNCKSNLNLAKYTLQARDREALKTTYDGEILRAEQELAGNAVAGTAYARLERRLQQLREDRRILDNPGLEELHTLIPQWVPLQYDPDDNGTLPCERSIVFIGDNRPFRRVSETSIPRWELSTAFCEVKLKLKSDGRKEASWHLRNSSFLSPGVKTTPFAASDHLSRGALLLDVYYHEMYPGPPFFRLWDDLDQLRRGVKHVASLQVLWVPVIHPEPYRGWSDEEGALGDLVQTVVQQLPQAGLVDDSLWPHQLVQYGYYDAVKPPPAEVAALALGTRRFCSWVVEQLSETADQALSELVGSGSKTLRVKTVDAVITRLEMANFGSLAMVRIALIILASLCVIIIVASDDHADDDDSGLPWSPETIAVRAVLLVRSRLRTAFASPNHSPGEINAIPELRVGRWKYDSTYVWRLDSKCNCTVVAQSGTQVANERHGDPAIWQRHSVSSLPVAAHSLTISRQLIFFLTLLGLTMFAIFHVGANTLNITPVPTGALPAIMASDATLQPSFRAIFWLAVLPQFLAFYLVACWNDLDQAVSARQPWAGLASPNPAHLNLTLNYMDGSNTNRLLKALKNKHYLIALLSVGSTMGFFLPILTAGIVRLDTGHHHVGAARSTQTQTWANQPAEVVDGNLPPGIPLSAINAIIRPPGDVKWVAHNHVMLPIDLALSEGVLVPLHESFWKVQTTSLHSKLDCQALTRATPHYGKSADFDGRQSLVIEAALPPGRSFADGTTNTTLTTCGDNNKELNASRVAETYRCAHWTLLSIKSDPDESDLRPAWFLVTVHGSLSQWVPSQGPIFNPGFETSTVLCEPRAYMSSGAAELVHIVDGGNGQSALHILDYVPDQERELDISVSWAFAQVLNRSMHAEDLEPDGLSSVRDMETSTMSADLLGYLALRYSPYSRSGSLSEFYGTLFANTLAESTWLRNNSTSCIELEQWQWTQVFRVRKFFLYAVILLVCFFLTSMAYLGVVLRRKDYLFPIAPEHLGDSLFFLYQSTIVDMLEAIAHPEDMSIEALHRAVEALGHKYVFGRYQDGNGHYEQYGVDVAEEFGLVNEEAETSAPRQDGWRPWRRYRDSPSDSESGDDDDEADTVAQRRRERGERGEQRKREHAEQQREHTEQRRKRAEQRRKRAEQRRKRAEERRRNRQEDSTDGARGGDAEGDSAAREQGEGSAGSNHPQDPSQPKDSTPAIAKGKRETEPDSDLETPEEWGDFEGNVDEVEDLQGHNPRQPQQAEDIRSTPGPNDTNPEPSASSNHTDRSPPINQPPRGGDGGERHSSNDMAETTTPSSSSDGAQSSGKQHEPHQNNSGEDQSGSLMETNTFSSHSDDASRSGKQPEPHQNNVGNTPSSHSDSAQSSEKQPGPQQNNNSEHQSTSEIPALVPARPRALSLSDFPGVAHLPAPGANFNIRQRRLSAGDAGASSWGQSRRRAVSLSDFPSVASLPDPV